MHGWLLKRRNFVIRMLHSIVRVLRLRKLKWARHWFQMLETITAHIILVGKSWKAST